MANHPNRSRRALRVFGGCFDGTTEHVVAARSQKEAAEAFRVSPHAMREFSHETGNEDDCAVALASPGTVFSRPTSQFSSPLVEGLLRYRRGDPWPPPSSQQPC